MTGIAIWKPVQLAPLTDLLGGYVWARYWQFVVMLCLVLLTVVHVIMVFAVDPYSIRSMITGGYNEGSHRRHGTRAVFWRVRSATLPNSDGGFDR